MIRPTASKLVDSLKKSPTLLVLKGILAQKWLCLRRGNLLLRHLSLNASRMHRCMYVELEYIDEEKKGHDCSQYDNTEKTSVRYPTS